MTAKIDDKVLDAVKGGATRLSAICAVVHEPERAVDRALQRLRKTGELKWQSTPGWMATEEEPKKDGKEES